MPRRLSPEKQLELDGLYRIVKVFGDFLDRLYPGLTPTAAESIERAYTERNLTGLRMLRNDFVGMADAASPAERRELDQLLRAQTSTSLDALSSKTLRRIHQIQARGRITSEEQYYLVRERLFFLESDAAREAECKALSQLLEAYELRALRRADQILDS